MKFIVSRNVKSVVNIEHIQVAYIHEDKDIDEKFDIIHTGLFAVKVILCGQQDQITLAKFDGGDAGENLAAAQKYFAELVNELNGGAA